MGSKKYVIVLIDRSPFTLKFAKKSVQTPPCERAKTTPGRVFLFEYNNFVESMRHLEDTHTLKYGREGG